MDNLAFLSRQIQIDFIKTLADQLENGSMDLPTAKKASDDLLKVLPFSSPDDIKTKIKSLTETYPQIGKMNAILLTYLDKQKTTEITDRLKTFMQQTE